MKLNSPLPQTLPKECAKAAKIFKSFVDSGNNGLDGVIPRTVLENARGFAIFTIFKAGFLFSARAGTGVVIAKLDDGTWSAPSAIGTAGLGFGGQAGAEMTDFLVVLNSRSAVRSFMAAGSLTLGGNMSIALGPLGRNGEASGSVNSSGKLAAMYSYSKTRGLFGGVSVEGSVIVERQDANAQAYQSDVTAKLLLGGAVEPPPWSATLIKTLEACTGMPGTRQWVNDGEATDGSYAFNGLASPGGESSSSSFLRKKKKEKPGKEPFPPDSWGAKKNSGSYFDDSFVPSLSEPRDQYRKQDNPATASFETPFKSDFMPEDQKRRHPRLSLSVSHSPSPDYFEQRSSASSEFPRPSRFASSPAHNRSFSANVPSGSSYDQQRHSSFSNPFASRSPGALRNRNSSPSPSDSGRSFNTPAPYIAPKPELKRPLLPHEGVARAIALYDFKAVEKGDLSFSKGNVITIIQKSNSTDDWWKGKVDGREGIFPANFVEVV